MNDYLKEFSTIDHTRWEACVARQECIQKYGFAIPSDEAIQALVDLSPIIEMGAGVGYWAKLVTDAGGTIEAYDKFLGLQNEYRFKHTSPWFDVNWGEPSLLTDHPEKTLFLCWPCYHTSFASECLLAFKGDRLVYIGEGRGGCTADDAFHVMLDSDWEVVGYPPIPHWDGIHDYMTIYRRKCAIDDASGS